MLLVVNELNSFIFLKEWKGELPHFGHFFNEMLQPSATKDLTRCPQKPGLGEWGQGEAERKRGGWLSGELRVRTVCCGRAKAELNPNAGDFTEARKRTAFWQRRETPPTRGQQGWFLAAGKTFALLTAASSQGSNVCFSLLGLVQREL